MFRHAYGITFFRPFGASGFLLTPDLRTDAAGYFLAIPSRLKPYIEPDVNQLCPPAIVHDGARLRVHHLRLHFPSRPS